MTPWRYRCPEGHTWLRKRHTRGVVVCRSCEKEYDHVIDAKTGNSVAV